MKHWLGFKRILNKAQISTLSFVLIIHYGKISRWREHREALFEGKETHIWLTDSCQPNNSSEERRLWEVLSAKERIRYSRFHFERDRHQYLVSRAMIRETLSRYRPNKSPECWNFITNKFGKPRIAESQCKGSLYFNLSHTRGFIVLAIHAHPTIGIDVEMEVGDIPSSSMLQYVFTSQEKTRYDLTNTAYKRIFFYRHWTLKEAYLKALGFGLHISMNSVGFNVESNHPLILQESTPSLRTPVEMFFESHSLSPLHIMSLAYKPIDNRRKRTNVICWDY